MIDVQKTPTNKALLAACIIGGLLFWVHGFLLLLFFAWPFGFAENNFALPRYALAALAASYPLALWMEKIGGWVMVVCAVALGAAITLNPKIAVFADKLVPALIAAAPSILVAVLFIRSAGFSRHG